MKERHARGALSAVSPANLEHSEYGAATGAIGTVVRMAPRLTSPSKDRAQTHGCN